MKTFFRSSLSLVGAGFFGAALVLASGANSPKAPVFPKYAVYNHGPFTHITDNEANKMYIYVNNADQPSKLIGYIDLTHAGQPELEAIKFEKGK